jgi:hypothetical protein
MVNPSIRMIESAEEKHPSSMVPIIENSNNFRVLETKENIPHKAPTKDIKNSIETAHKTTPVVKNTNINSQVNPVKQVSRPDTSKVSAQVLPKANPPAVSNKNPPTQNKLPSQPQKERPPVQVTNRKRKLSSSSSSSSSEALEEGLIKTGHQKTPPSQITIKKPDPKLLLNIPVISR